MGNVGVNEEVCSGRCCKKCECWKISESLQQAEGVEMGNLRGGIHSQLVRTQTSASDFATSRELSCSVRDQSTPPFAGRTKRFPVVPFF